MTDERDKADGSPERATDEVLGDEALKPKVETASVSAGTDTKSSDASDESVLKTDGDSESASERPRVGAPVSLPPVTFPKPSYVFLAVVALMALALDLVTKAWAVDHLGGPHTHRMVIVENFFHLDLAENKGGAWGIFGDQPDYIRLPFFFIISAIAVVFVVSLYKRLEPRQVALRWALPLLLGGAAGNLTDRIRHQYVVDFLDVFITRDGHQTHWPTFNVADVWIVVGVALMTIDMFTPRRAVPAKPHEEAEAKA